MKKNAKLEIPPMLTFNTGDCDMEKCGLIGMLLFGIFLNAFCTEQLINIVHFASVEQSK
jgi:hypothetical protein